MIYNKMIKLFINKCQSSHKFTSSSQNDEHDKHSIAPTWEYLPDAHWTQEIDYNDKSVSISN
jgi:hypothetical protein